jgi:hypothetical protein
MLIAGSNHAGHSSVAGGETSSGGFGRTLAWTMTPIG